MAIWISFLRGINVAGNRNLKMDELEKIYVSLGFQNVQTYRQSGNVIFSHKGKDESGISTRIENALKTRKGLEVKIFLRSPNELARIVESHPFRNKDRTRVHVTLLHSKPVEVPTSQITAVAAEGEEFALSNGEVFLFLPNGQGRTKLSNNFFEKTLGVAATTRNWNTITGVLELVRKGANAASVRTLTSSTKLGCSARTDRPRFQ